MTAYDIPPRVVAQIDQDHAAADSRLAVLLDVLVCNGVAGLDAPERAIGVALELRDLDRANLVEIAATAVGRLLEEINSRCHRCGGEGTVYVRHYGGHTVDCGACRGTGTAHTNEGAPRR
jgi:hypothetical protein